MSDHRRRVIRHQYNVYHSTPIDDNKRAILVRKKSDGLMCSICEAPAHGYNFDAITCESCKAFFRRNALRSDKKFKCRANNGQCVINIQTRKRCKACRLEKCFATGMRADWILTDEERLNKRLKIEENRRLRQLLYPDSSDDLDELPDIKPKIEALEFPSMLSSEDLKKIDQIQRAFTDSVRLTLLPREFPLYPNTAQLDAPWDMMNLPTNLQASRLITYFKLLPEFSSLNEIDKITLIKYNTFTLAFIRAALNYDPATDRYHEANTDDCIFQGKDLIQCFSHDQYVKSTRCVCRLFEASTNDPLILRLLLIIILFSKGSFICTYTPSAEPIAHNIRSIYQAQNIFIDLLWKYCENRFGLVKSVEIWLKLVTASMDAHLQSFNTLHNYVNNERVAEHLVPLMKSVVLIN